MSQLNHFQNVEHHLNDFFFNENVEEWNVSVIKIWILKL